MALTKPDMIAPKPEETYRNLRMQCILTGAQLPAGSCYALRSYRKAVDVQRNKYVEVMALLLLAAAIEARQSGEQYRAARARG
jgi:hypothetical protein